MNTSAPASDIGTETRMMMGSRKLVEQRRERQEDDDQREREGRDEAARFLLELTRRPTEIDE